MALHDYYPSIMHIGTLSTSCIKLSAVVRITAQSSDLSFLM